MTYVLGHRSESGKKAQQGTACHKVMECLAACTKDVQDHPADKKTPRSIVDDALGEVSFTEAKLKTNASQRKKWEAKRKKIDKELAASRKKAEAAKKKAKKAKGKGTRRTAKLAKENTSNWEAYKKKHGMK